MDFTSKKSVKNPCENAGILSQLFFWWAFPVLRKGSKKNLDINDMYDCLKKDEAGRLGQQLEDAWNNEKRKAKLTGERPRFYRAILKIFLMEYIFVGLVYFVNECGLRMVQFVYLYKLINSFTDGSSVTDQYINGSIIVGATFVFTATMHWPRHGCPHVGMRCRIACSSLIYRKALKLSKAAQNQASVGQVVNLMSGDVFRFDPNLAFIAFIFLGPIQLAIMLYFLWTWGEFGATSLTGVGFLLFLLPFQYYISILFANNRFETAKRTDKRSQIMNEIIMAMRVIKMYAWEKPFSAMVDELRRLEVGILKKTMALKALYMSMYISSSQVLVYLTILVHLLSGGELKASSVFLLVAASNIIKQVMVYFVPYGAAHWGELIVSVNRIEDFLLLEELTPTGDNDPTLRLQDSSKKHAEASVKMENACASWTPNTPTLKDITLNLQGDKLVIVIGSVGSGKTSFLNALISELPIYKGKCIVTGRTSYAAQEPWIFAGNIRQNILFGREYDLHKYKDVVEVSSLQDDFKQLPYGENTIAGERGAALSGGQKARVNLARALYQDADIYLLDDPLSAVDTRVSRHIFENCIQGYLKGKLRILVTHQLQYLPRADHIVVMSHGEIAAQGTYLELVEKGVDFMSFITDDDEEMKGRTRSKSISSEANDKELNKDDEKPERKDEKMSGGSVGYGVFKEYFQAGGSLIAVVSIVLGFIVYQALFSLADYWLSYWVRKAAKSDCHEATTSSTNFPNSTEQPCEDFDDNFYFYVYTGIVVGIFLIVKATAIHWSQYCMKISIKVHDNMFKSMVRAPTKFYDDNPTGRILNRFTKDIGTMDELLPSIFFDAVCFLLLMVGSICTVVAANYYLALPAFILAVALLSLRRFYVKTAADVKRIEALARSPIFTHLSATLQGLTTIRASQRESILIKQFEASQNIHSAVWFVSMGGNRWFGMSLDMCTFVFITCVTYGFMVLSGFQDFDGGQVGLAISSCMSIAGTFQWGMRQWTETESQMTSVERAVEYAKLKPEAPLDSNKDKKPPKDWPTSGAIRFQNVFLAYEDADVLKNVTFELRDKEKIGIVGRTGAGKSTIIAALFRMTEPRGDVFVDDVRINDIGLHDLRKNVSIIPQDPVLFSGSIRYNLDPFDQFPDDELWKAIEEVELKEAINALDFKVADGGSNFSVGQRQLVCLARAILRKNRILIMDEATANVDPRTDSFIQTTIRTKFADCSIITVAHRLHSVMDCDKILVLDQGILVEYDHPHILLRNPNGILTTMVAHTGSANSIVLRQVAKDTYKRTQGGLGSFSADNVSILSQVSIPNKRSSLIGQGIKILEVQSDDSEDNKSADKNENDPATDEELNSATYANHSGISKHFDDNPIGSDVDEAESVGSDVDEI